jgi:hypothetical protein
MVDRLDVPNLVGLAHIDRLDGLLVRSIEVGELEIDEQGAADARHAWHESLVASVTIEALAVRVTDRLRAAGLRFAITKGPAVAHLDYPDPALRPFGDVDVVIHPADWRAALGVFEAGGLHREVPELRPGFDDRFGKGATYCDPAGWEVDVHRRFSIGRFGVGAEMAELFDRLDHIELAGREVPVLGREDRLLHACFHASLGGFRGLRAFRDVAQLVVVSGADWERTVETARRWRAEAVVVAALLDTWERLELEVGHPAIAWARTTPVDRRDRRALAVFAAERPFRYQAATAMSALPWGQRLPYAWALAVPVRGVNRSVRRGWGRRVVSAVRGLRGRPHVGDV